MKRLNYLILLFCAFLVMAPEAHSQRIPGFLKRKIEKHADKAADAAISGALERLIEKKLDQLFGLDDKNVEVRGDTIIVRDSLEGGETVIVAEDPPANPEPSSFTGTFTMHMESFKKGKMDKGFPVEMTYHIDEYAMAIEISGDQEATMIIDRKARTMTTKMENDGKKVAMVMPLRNYKVQSSSMDMEKDITETGNTKEIDGYHCREFILDSKDDISHVWVTDEIHFDYEQMAKAVQLQNRNNKAINSWNGIDGVMLYSETELKKKDVRHTMALSNYKPGKVDSKVFSLKGYDVQEMPAFLASRSENAGE